jgi:alpha/beta superfamily hydrolase
MVWHAWGAVSAPTLVLLHGGSGSWTHWLRCIAPLRVAGWRVLVPDLPGFGDSGLPEGCTDVDDLPPHLHAGLQQLQAAGLCVGPVCVAGFSFGAFVTSHVIQALGDQRLPQSVVLVGTAASRFEVAPLPQMLHDRCLVLHGEQDDTVPLTSVLDWARPQFLPITVIPGVEHFFHGQLPLLKSLVIRHLNN